MAEIHNIDEYDYKGITFRIMVAGVGDIFHIDSKRLELMARFTNPNGWTEIITLSNGVVLEAKANI